MKKRILSMFIAIAIVFSLTQSVVAYQTEKTVVLSDGSAVNTIIVSYRDQVSFWASGQNLTNEQLAELVAIGTIPPNTTELVLCFNQISNLTPLEDLTRLSILSLTNNQISDISPLMELSNLVMLSLCNNQISDLSPLATSNFSGCEFMGFRLCLSNNQISDLSPLVGLTQLTRLELNDNQITDVSHLTALTRLGMGMGGLRLQNNQISDISPLAWLPNLDQFSLRLEGNPVTSVQLAELEEARAANRTRTTLTLGHWLGYIDFTMADAIEIMRFLVGLPSVLDDCGIAQMAALIVSEETPGIRDAVEILRFLVGTSSALD